MSASRLRMALAGAGAAAAALIIAPAAQAEDAIKSAYTKFDARKCAHQRGKGEEDGGSWTCPGLGKLKVRLGEGDQRMTVTFGGPDRDEDAFETFPAFNDIYEGTVEWRIETTGGKDKPFATILRWNVMTGDDMDKGKASARVLVVTRLDPGGRCQVGYVDARANPNANELARKIADETARGFKCGKDKRVVLGAVTPGLAMPGAD